jgi:hypothetical protein
MIQNNRMNAYSVQLIYLIKILKIYKSKGVTSDF